MPGSLVPSACPPPLFSSKLCQPNSSFYSPNSSITTTLFSSFHSLFNPIPLSTFALHKPALCLPLPKTRIVIITPANLSPDHFADQIRQIPAPDKWDFIYAFIQEHGLSKNICYINDVIMGLVIADELDNALKLFDEMPAYGLPPDGWTYSVLIRCYCKKNDPDEGRRVLVCMTEKGFRPNVVTLTVLVNSFCSRGRIESAFEMLEIMTRLGCDPNVQTYNCVLKGLCFVGRVEDAYKMLMTLKTKGDQSKPDIYSYTAVMDGFCKVGRSDEAMELLDEAVQMGLTPNVITYNTLFNGYCKEGKPRKGIRLLKRMKESACMPDYITYTTLLHGLLKWNKALPGFWVYKEMVKVGFKVDERTMNTLLRGLCKESWVEEGLMENVDGVLDKMKSWGYAIFPETYYLLSHAFCIAKEVDRAMIIIHEMVDAGYFPRMVTINRIIRGLCEEERISEALAVMVVVSGTNRIPSKISYNILIDELNRQGKVLGACNVYGAALKLGVVPHKVPLCVHST